MAALAALCACNHGAEGRHFKPGLVPVVATAGVLASIAQSVGGSQVQVQSLVPPGAMAETFEPTPREIATLHDARVLLENGAGYETWISKVLDSAANPKLKTVVLSLGVKKVADNPHLWMDPARARVYARRIRNALISVDPAHTAQYRHNDAAYEHSLRRLQHRIALLIATVPKSRRVMIVSHDAWSYYAQRFGLRVLGVIETAPGREPSADHLDAIITAARKHRVHVVFSEFEEAQQLSTEVARELPGGKVVPLYVDTLPASDGTQDYRSMLWYDTKMIVAGLKYTPKLPMKKHPAAPTDAGTDSDTGTDSDRDVESDTGAADVKPVPVTPLAGAKARAVKTPAADASDGDE